MSAATLLDRFLDPLSRSTIDRRYSSSVFPPAYACARSPASSSGLRLSVPVIRLPVLSVYASLTLLRSRAIVHVKPAGAAVLGAWIETYGLQKVIELSLFF